jgi:TonB-dependent receptor
MKKFALILLVGILGFSTLFAQGTITGVVTKSSNAPLSGASITVLGLGEGTQSDANGAYKLKIAAGTYEVEFKAVGYTKKVVGDVVVKDNENLVLNVTLEKSKNRIDEITVKTTMKKENINALITVQKNSATVMDAISAEAIKRTPDRNTADVLKRVSGLTISDGRFVVVRGLSDRYNNPFINGAILPSTDDTRKAFSFDIIPSNSLENITIIKSATADMPSDFAGGNIYLTTKEASDKRQTTLQLGTSMNLQVIGNNFFGGIQAANDFIGLGNKGRAYPSSMPNSNDLNALSFNDRNVFAKQMNNNYNFYRSDNGFKQNGPINRSLQATHNFKVKLSKERSIALVTGVSYNSSFRTDFTKRAEYSPQGFQGTSMSDTSCRNNVNASAIANATFAINKQNKISLKNLYAITTEEENVSRFKDVVGNWYDRSSTMMYTNSKLLSSQLIGEHKKIYKKLRLDWIVGFNNTKRVIPSIQRLTYRNAEPGNPEAPYSVALGPNFEDAGFFSSDLSEQGATTRVDFSSPITLISKDDNLKFGAFNYYRTRNYSARTLAYARADENSFDFANLYRNVDSVLLPQYFSKTGYTIIDQTKAGDYYKANSNVSAGYVSYEGKLSNKLKLIAGSRVENFNLNLMADAGNGDTTININNVNFLPSINLVFLQNAKTNIRLSGSKTVSRPEFRELSPFAFYDFSTNRVVRGDINLQTSRIWNADLRYEFFPGKGEILSVGTFYKYFDKPIESIYTLGGTGDLTRLPRNTTSSINYGVELDFRKSLGFLSKDEDNWLNDLTLFGNMALIKSKVNYILTGITPISIERPLEGQARYILNTGATYINKKYNFGSTISVNRIGERLILVGLPNQTDDIYEKPRTVIDIQMAKEFMKKFEARFTVQDLLNQPVITYVNLLQNATPGASTMYNASTSKIVSDTKQGTTIGLTVAYKF